MNIVFLRVDERLAHGQVITSWTRQLQVKKIIVVDDTLSKDSFMCEVMKMAAPTGVSVEILSINQTLARVQEDVTNENAMLLFKTVEQAYKLYQAGYPMKRLNIGNIGSGPGRKGITKRVFMSPQEIEMAKELSKSGVYVYLQMLNSEPEVDILKQL